MIYSKLRRLRWKLIVGITVLSIHSGVSAEFQFNYFGTIGAGFVEDENVTGASALDYGSFNEDIKSESLTRLGIQGRYSFNDQFSVTVQAVSKQANNFGVDLEWGYISYTPNDQSRFRLGAMNRSLFEYTDTLFVGFGYQWVQPPPSVYVNIEELYGNLNAINYLHYGEFGNIGFSTELYYGVNDDEGKYLDFTTELKTDFNAGVVLTLDYSNLSVRLGAHQANYTISIDALDQAAGALSAAGFGNFADSLLLVDETANFYSIGGNYTFEDWTLFGEVIQVAVSESIAPNLDAAYVGLQRNFNKLSVNITIGEQSSNTINNVSQELENLSVLASQSPDPTMAAAFAQIAQQVSPIVNSVDISRLSTSVGFRYDLSSTFVLKGVIDRITDRNKDDDTVSVGISLDFIY